MSSTKTEKTAKEKETMSATACSKAMSAVFIFFCVVTVIGLFPFTYYGYTYTEMMRKTKPEGYHWPGFEDMVITAASSVFFAITELAVPSLFIPIFRPYCKVQPKEGDEKKNKEHERRTQKMGYSFYRFLYFLGATAWGFIVLKDEHWFPKELGGTGRYVDTFKEFPYGNHCKGMKEYLLITMGFHVGGLVTHFFGERRNDFLELSLHHMAAIYLFGGCYLYNVWEIGGVIAYLHDIADITTNLLKTSAESNF